MYNFKKYCQLKRGKLLLIVLAIFVVYIILNELNNPIRLYQGNFVLTFTTSRFSKCLRNKSLCTNQYRTPKLTNLLWNNSERFHISNFNTRIIGDWRIPLFPREIIDDSENILLNQIRFIPEKIFNIKVAIKSKLIVWHNPINRERPVDDDLNMCPVKQCIFSNDTSLLPTADVIVYMHDANRLTHKRPPYQIWSYASLESPFHQPRLRVLKDDINWTISYRHDATIPIPYGIFLPYDMTKPVPKRYPMPTRNFAKGKRKMAAAFVSNCNSRNMRNYVIAIMQKHVKVDVYGACGDLICPRSSEICFTNLKKYYKFYLAFENSNCRDYITEKFFYNALSHDVIPIVMGAHPDDYKRVAPPYSYIHIDDFKNIKELTDYMRYLDKNETAYNEYFGWKNHGMIFNTTFFYCRLCMMAHQAEISEPITTNLPKWQWEGLWDPVKKNNSKIGCIGPGKWT